MFKINSLIISVILYLLPVFSWGLMGTVQNNQYIAPVHSLMVTIPPVSNMQITDGFHGGMHYVNFFPGKTANINSISYSIEWFDLNNPPQNITAELKLLPAQMLSDTKPDKITFDECTIVKDASQCIATFHLSSISMKLVGSSMISNNRLIDIFMMVPMPQTIPWVTYDNFIKSII